MVTLREQVAPELADPTVRTTVERLVALAEYARDRGPDDRADLDDALRGVVGDDDVVDVLCDPDDERRPAVRTLLRDSLARSIEVEAGLLDSLGFVGDGAVDP